MTTQDPLFFAEEFTARRRRYVPTTIDVTGISRLPQYKDFNFPFMTGQELQGKPESYNLLFKTALETRFPDIKSYRPTTRFEAMSYEVYRVEAQSSGTESSRLERVRKLFVNSLLDNQQVDLSLLRTTPHIPEKGDFSSIPPAKGTPVPSSRTLFTQASGGTTPYILQNYPYYLSVAINKLISDSLVPKSRATLLDLQVIVSLASILRQRLIDLEQEANRLNEPVALLLRTNINRLELAITSLQNEVNSRGGSPELVALGSISAGRIEAASQRAFQAAVTGKLTFPQMEQSINLAIDNGKAARSAGYAAGSAQNVALGITSVSAPELLDAAGKIKDVKQDTIITDIPRSTLEQSLNNMSVTNNTVSSSLTTPPAGPISGRAHGYLTEEFRNYLAQIAHGTVPPDSSRCDEVLFKDQPVDTGTPLSVDMAMFMRSVSPQDFGRPSSPEFASTLGLGDTSGLYKLFGCPSDDMLKAVGVKPGPLVDRINASTIEEAYRELQLITGTTLERYLKFVRFVYFFFDHIPEVQPVVSALLAPLVGMYAGIIQRGIYDFQMDSPLLLLQEDLQRVTTFLLATEAFDERSTREEATRAVIRMYRNFVRPRAAINALLLGDPRDVTEVGYTITKSRDLRADFLKIPIDEKRKDIRRAKALYAKSGIVEFNLPSVGSAHMILPAILGIAEANILSQVYDLSARWFPSEKEQQRAIKAIDTAGYRIVSSRRYGYTTAGITALPAPPKTGVLISPRPAGGYIDSYVTLPASDLKNHYDDTLLPFTWEQLLYPAYVSHAIVEQELLRDVAKTLVRPCLQTDVSATSFASDLELTGGYVEVQGETDPEVFSAVFEFPADVVSVVLPTTTIGPPSLLALRYYPGDSKQTSSTSYSILRRGTSRVRTEAHGSIRHQMVSALNVSDVIDNVGAWSTRSLTLDSNPLTAVPILQNRTRYIWSSLPGATDPSILAPTITAGTSPAMKFDTTVGDLFIPALDTEFFLSSLFDWKLQLFYLRDLRIFLQGRTYLKPSLDKIAAAMATLPDTVRRSLQDATFDEGAARSYIKNNSMTMLVSTAIPYAGFRNLVFAITGPTASSNLSDLLKTTEVIKASGLTTDTKKFYLTQSPTPPRGPLNYDLDIDSYLNLLKARAGDITSVEEKPTDAKKRIDNENREERERRLAELKTKSAERLKDPYSILVDEIITRAMFK